MKDVPGYEGLYAVTDDGRVWGYPKKRGRGKRYEVPGRWKSLNLLPAGYLYVSLYKDSRAKNFLIHRLVAQVFIPSVDGKFCVNHKDCDKANNKVDNLEWCTHQENTRHALENGRNIFGWKKNGTISI